MPTNWKTVLLHSNAKAPDGFRSLTTPVYRGSTTVFRDASTVVDNWDHDEAAYTYGLYGTPTTLELAARVAELEHGYRCFITPGGQSALALVYFACVSAGQHVLVPESVYGPSRKFAEDLLRRYGVDVEFYPPLIAEGIGALIKDSTRLIWCESPGSVTMEVQDVPAIVDIAHRRGVVVALDNTWSAGVLFDAFRHGVDVTMQALTKYIGGHSDLLLGSVTVRDREHYQKTGGRTSASWIGCLAGRLQLGVAGDANARGSTRGDRGIGLADRTVVRPTSRDRDRPASGFAVVSGP